ncbi:cytidine deaminase-like protein, partial [Flagelloscypha sp. PMI_526]
LTPDERQKLIQAAFEAKKGSYSPYSKFPVGAALLTPDGSIIKGANIENASYGGTICAERTALVKAASDGVRKFIGLAVVTNIAEPCSPCGICRQFIREFCSLDLPILLIPGDYDETKGVLVDRLVKPFPFLNTFPGAGEKHQILDTTLGDLLPHSFGPEHL